MDRDFLGEVLIYLFIIVGIVSPLTYFLLWVSDKAARKYFSRLIKKNFRGDTIPVTGGWPLIILGVLFILGQLFLEGDSQSYIESSRVFGVSLIGFGALGLNDDIFGDRSVGGFRGHFHSLFIKRQITTGFVKLLGGGLLALWIAYSITPFTHDYKSVSAGASWFTGLAPFTRYWFWFSVIIVGLFIALSTNTFNLLDLRPGRCSVVAILCILPLLLTTLATWAVLILGAMMVIYYFDRSAQVMLGDSGSNPIGAVIAALYSLILPMGEILMLALLLLAFNIWSEKHSLNKLIEDTPWLRSIDRKIGVR